MKRILCVFVGTALLSATGCATKGFVRSELDPVAERLSRLEAAVSDLSGKLGQTDSALKADRAAIGQANEKAQKALEATQKLGSGARPSDEEVKRAEEAASRAEAAAKEAENAAKESERDEKKSEKIFKLEQHK